ncbi:hypothetical protein [Paraglaciecola aestuariivivens]
MSNQNAAYNTSSKEVAPKRKTWFTLFIAIILVAGFGYYLLLNQHAASLNHDFYRVLYEASNQFNENLNSLHSMHESEESEVSIRSLLPSYARQVRTPPDNNIVGFNYLLTAQKIIIEHKKLSASIDLRDILPDTSQGFSQYLFADSRGTVLANTGGEKTISIVEMTSINKKLIQKNNLSALNFNANQESGSELADAPLPTFSSHIDMQLSHGDFRIFIFPFSVSTPLKIKSPNKETSDNIEKLYLVGLLPKQQLKNKGSGHWNISLLVVSLISLMFSWAMLRLFLLPAHQSITSYYRIFSQSASYLFYIVLVALILSYLTKSGLQSYKDQQALLYAQQLSKDLQKDLKEVFNELGSYRDFYSDTKAELQTLKPIESKLDQDERPLWSYQQTVDALNKALTQLAQDRKDCTSCYFDKALPDVVASETWHAPLSTTYQQDRWYSAIKVNERQTSYTKKMVQSQSPPTSADDRPNNQETPNYPYHQGKNELGVLSFFAGALKTHIDNENNVFNSYIERQEIYDNVIDIQTDYKLPKVLTIFATDQTGYANLPSIYFQESNAKPQAYQLSHRDYFKKVRDYRGWLLDFSELSTEPQNTEKDQSLIFRNVYIQRLLNINDGTRGTTISVPMHQPNLGLDVDLSVAGLVLGADVILPSVSLAPPAPFDFVFMLVDRNTGDLLFHSDEERSLAENLFYAGQNDSQLNHWIKAGLDKQATLNSNQLNGFYHGEAGRFTLAPTQVDDWVMVVFSPNDSLDSFMTNQFFYIFFTFVFILFVILLVIKLFNRWITTEKIKEFLALPAALDTKRVLLICTAVFTTNYGLFYIGQLLQMSFPGSDLHHLFSPIIPLLGMAALLIMHYRFYLVHFASKDPSAERQLNFQQGAKLFSMGLWLIALMHFVYLQFSAAMPLKSLDFYYSQQACNGVNKEFTELTQIALKRYPNSVTEQRIPPFALLPMQKDWQAIMLAKNGAKKLDESKLNSLQHLVQCQDYLSSVTPQDYPKMSTLVGASFLWKWMKTYLINPELTEQQGNAQTTQTNPEYDLILLSIAVLLALVWAWFYYNRKVLWPKIYCSNAFLQHVEGLSKIAANLAHEQPNKQLKIKLGNHKLSGVGLTLLIRNQLNCLDKTNQDCNQTLLTEFAHLFQLSPCLQNFSQNNTALPNLKLDLAYHDGSGLLKVKIWDIETCLDNLEYRRNLLDLIMEIKSLTMSGHLHSFTIYAGFMSFRRVKMNDPFASRANNHLEQTEYLSWSECLMDFCVSVPDSFMQKVDPALLAKEVEHLSELQFLLEQLPKDLQAYLKNAQAKQGEWSNRAEFKSTDSDWATLHYILLHADALYRFKWESCSSAEKLALYNLAKQHRLNPNNTEMIEHLALNGMIKVHKDHLAIINKSFAHFVLHAETTDTLKQLVQEGEAGVWKSYRLPLGMLIVLIVGGIALTSGQSIFIIAASLAGVLGTIGSLTNSASMLRGQFKG